MKNPNTYSANFRSVALGLTLGLFSFHLYVVNSFNVAETGRSLASEDAECTIFPTIEELEASENECRLHYSLNSETDNYDITAIHGTNTSILSVSSESLGLDDDATASEIRNTIIAGISINRGEGIQISYGDGDETAAEAAEVTVAAAPVEDVELDAEPDAAEVVAEDEDEPMSLSERIAEATSQVEELSQCLSDENETAAERLLSRADSYSRNRPEDAEDKLNELDELLAEVSEDGECTVAEGEDDDAPAAAPGTAGQQWARYNTEFLPQVRQAMANNQSLDGIDGLEELARSNESIDRALAIEARVYTISVGLRNNTSQILRLQNTPGADPSQVQALEAENQNLLTQLTAESTAHGELSPYAQGSVAFWNNVHGTEQAAAVALAGPAQRILEQGSAVDAAFGLGAGRAPAPGSRYAGEVANLDEFLNLVSQSSRNIREQLTETRNRQGERARTNGRQRLEAPENRRLNFTGGNRALQ